MLRPRITSVRVAMEFSRRPEPWWLDLSQGLRDLVLYTRSAFECQLKFRNRNDVRGMTFHEIKMFHDFNTLRFWLLITFFAGWSGFRAQKHGPAGTPPPKSISHVFFPTHLDVCCPRTGKFLLNGAGWKFKSKTRHPSKKWEWNGGLNTSRSGCFPKKSDTSRNPIVIFSWRSKKKENNRHDCCKTPRGRAGPGLILIFPAKPGLHRIPWVDYDYLIRNAGPARHKTFRTWTGNLTFRTDCPKNLEPGFFFNRHRPRKGNWPLGPRKSQQCRWNGHPNQEKMGDPDFSDRHSRRRKCIFLSGRGKSRPVESGCHIAPAEHDRTPVHPAHTFAGRRVWLARSADARAEHL